MNKLEKDPYAGKYFITCCDGRIARKGRVLSVMGDEAAGKMYLVEFLGEFNELGIYQEVVPAADLEGATLFASSEEYDAAVRAETRKTAGK